MSFGESKHVSLAFSGIYVVATFRHCDFMLTGATLSVLLHKCRGLPTFSAPSFEPTQLLVLCRERLSWTPPVRDHRSTPSSPCFSFFSPFWSWVHSSSTCRWHQWRPSSSSPPQNSLSSRTLLLISRCDHGLPFSWCCSRW